MSERPANLNEARSGDEYIRIDGLESIREALGLRE